MITCSRDAIRKKCQLGTGSARHFDFVDLHSIGKTRADEDFAPLWMPGKNGCAAKLRVAICLLRNLRRNSWNALDEEILTPLHRCGRGGLLRAGKMTDR